MYVYVKTHDELLASGWRRCSDGSYTHVSAPMDIVGDMVDSLGVEIELPCPAWDGEPQRNRGGYWIPEMVRVRRVKTADELRADGWAFEGEPNSGARVVVSDMLPYLGTYIPVRRRRNSNGALSTFAGCAWSSDMFVGTAPETPARPVREVQAEFRDTDLDTALRSITCGFELETQESAGETWDTVRQTKYDEPAIIAACRAYVDTYYPLTFVTFVECWHRVYGVPARLVEGSGSYTVLAQRLEAAGVRTPEDAVRLGYLREGQVTAISERHIEEARRYIRVENYRTSGDPQAFFRDRGVNTELVQVGSDASVRGFEFRTVGGLTFDQFQDAARGLFSVSHDIDVACSFHVHVKVGAIRHMYGERMQQALTEYLVENIDAVPVDVRARWATIRERSHIQPGVKTDKYAFVHAHPQGTWEFRCFGNVRSAEDGVHCLKLAVLAMQHAYRVLAGQAPLMTDSLGLTQESWKELVLAALENGTTLSAAYESAPDRYPSAA
jgi:hypothetical protein